MMMMMMMIMIKLQLLLPVLFLFLLLFTFTITNTITITVAITSIPYYYYYFYCYYYSHCYYTNNTNQHRQMIHPGRLTWNLQITHLERKMIFQTSMIMFHVNLPGCNGPTSFFGWDVYRHLKPQGLQIQLGNEQKPLVVECFHLGFTLGGYNTKYGGYTSYGSLTPDFVLNIGCCTKYPCGCPPSQDASVNQDDGITCFSSGKLLGFVV